MRMRWGLSGLRKDLIFSSTFMIGQSRLDHSSGGSLEETKFCVSIVKSCCCMRAYKVDVST